MPKPDEAIKITIEITVNGVPIKRGITVEKSQRFTAKQFGELVENTINDDRDEGLTPLRAMAQVSP
jgi:hypothetical protein